MGLDQISFLAADVDAASDAFNRRASLAQVADGTGAPAKLLLNENEVDEFEAVVEATIRTHARDFQEDRVAPGPEGLRRLVSTYRAHLGQGSFRSPSCNAPWASIFIEADGGVRPCSSTRPWVTCGSGPGGPAVGGDAGFQGRPGRRDGPDVQALRLLAAGRPADEALVSGGGGYERS